MNQANLFAATAGNPSNISSGRCRFPDKLGLSSYSYGCRCQRCRAAKKDANDLARQTGSCAPRCAEPGCDNARRRVQGARYCADHSTSIDYTPTGIDHKPIRPCAVCGTAHRSSSIYPLCSQCVERNRGVVISARRHNAPLDLLVSWIARRRCDLCARPLYLGKRKGIGSGTRVDGPHVDHDHRCCEGRHSCGDCIRGLLCPSCNLGLGAAEQLFKIAGVDAMLAYRDGRSF